MFAGIGVPHDTAEQFRLAMESSGALGHTAMFLNLADEPGMQRLLTPRYALTAAEYLAFEEGRHVLVILTDMTNYCEALREVSASHGEIPGRKGYPGYMYSDLAALYERAGCIRGAAGHAHAVADPDHARRRHRPPDPGPDRLHHRRPDRARPRARPEGHLSAGQGAAEPVAADGAGIGEGFTDPDHPALAHQLFAAYARALRSARARERDGRAGPAGVGSPVPRVRRPFRAQVRAPGTRADARGQPRGRLGGAARRCRTASSRACRTRRSAGTWSRWRRHA